MSHASAGGAVPAGADLRLRRNLVPGAYRGVAVSHLADAGVDGELTEAVLRQHFLGREVYRRTRFVVARSGGSAPQTALLHVVKASEEPLFCPVTDLTVIALPGECAYVTAPDADTAVPSDLAAVALREAPQARAVVVEGRYRHVSFIVNPEPLTVVVQEVVPPEPAKLVDQVRRLLAVAEDLPPIRVVADTVSLPELAAAAPAQRYLLPCNGSGVAIGDAETDYLDRRPPRRDWTLLGCRRSAEIHRWCYGDDAATVSICPREREAAGDTAVLTKCCLLEAENAAEAGRVVVPWGASLEQVLAALRELVRVWEPAWRPA